MLSNTHVLIAPNDMHPVELPVQLKSQPAKVADASATVDPDVRVIEPHNNKRQCFLGIQRMPLQAVR